MTAEASGPPEALALGAVPLLLEAAGDEVLLLPQAATRIRVNPIAPRVIRGRCIRPPPQGSIGWVKGAARRLGDHDGGGPVPAAASFRVRDRRAASSAG